VKTIASKLTYANVMATIAVFIALGGASYAATGLPGGDQSHLGRTMTVVGEIGPVAANSFRVGHVKCPKGFEATGGGVDPSNVVNGKVSSSAPLVNGVHARPDRNLPADGWFGAISTQGGEALDQPSPIVVICSKVE
jgi:hypothetical protein